MKNFITKSPIYLSIYLSILFLGLVGISSCQDAGQDDVLEQLNQEVLKMDPVAYEISSYYTGCSPVCSEN